MERRVNFTLVGLMVTLFFIAILGFAFWLLKYGSAQEYRYYHIYIEESIAGLSKDSSVKYLGVDAGVVDKIEVNPENTQQIQITVKLKDNIIIKEDMTATLKFYGLTGLAYLEIVGFDNHAKRVQAKAGEIAVIKSSPSVYIKLDESLSMIASKLAVALDKVDKLLQDQNLQNIESSLANLRQITQTLDQNKAHFITLLQEGAKAGPLFDDLRRSSKAAKEMIEDLDQSIKKGDTKLETLLEESLSLVLKLQNTVDMIEKSPSDLLFKNTPEKLGPGETK